MKETPIIMSGNHPKLVLDGKKTVTRRVVTTSTSEVGEGKVDWSKFCWDGSQIYRDTCRHGHTEIHKAPLPFVDGKGRNWQYLHVPYDWEEDMTIFRIYPRYEVGDRLWVRETWHGIEHPTDRDSEFITYKATAHPHILKTVKWRPSIFMPRWASRITLEITEVRVERLQEITEEDARAEGLVYHKGFSQWYTSPDTLVFGHKTAFQILWDSLNAKRGYGWDTNPWVWPISFKVVK